MTKQVIPPPAPPHLAKGHNCPNSPRATPQRPHRPQHTRAKHRHKKGEGPTIRNGSQGPPYSRMRHLTDTHGAPPTSPTNQVGKNRVRCLNPRLNSQGTHPAGHTPPSTGGRRSITQLPGPIGEQSTTSELGTAASQWPPKLPAGKTYSNAPWPHSPSHADH